MTVADKIRVELRRKGDIVFAEGEASNGSMYFIFSGEIEISRQGLGVLRSLSQGHFFGEMALVRAIPRTATATVTSEEAKLGRIDIQTFAGLAKKNPKFLESLIGVVATRAARAMKRAENASV